MFRPEALEQRARKRAEGDVVRLAPRWTAWAFYALLASVVGALIATLMVDIDRHAIGVTAAGADRLVVLVPEAAGRPRPGARVEAGESQGEVISVEPRVIGVPEAAERFGVTVASPSFVVLVDTPALTPRPPTARVHVGSEPMLIALVPGLKALFGADG